MSIANAALLILQDSLLSQVLMLVIYFSLEVLLTFEEGRKEIVGCEASFLVLLMPVVYGWYHVVAYSLVEAVIVWGTALTGMYLYCAIDLAMMTDQIETIQGID